MNPNYVIALLIGASVQCLFQTLFPDWTSGRKMVAGIALTILIISALNHQSP